MAYLDFVMFTPHIYFHILILLLSIYFYTKLTNWYDCNNIVKCEQTIISEAKQKSDSKTSIKDIVKCEQKVTSEAKQETDSKTSTGGIVKCEQKVTSEAKQETDSKISSEDIVKCEPTKTFEAKQETVSRTSAGDLVKCEPTITYGSKQETDSKTNYGDKIVPDAKQENDPGASFEEEYSEEILLAAQTIGNIKEALPDDDKEISFQQFLDLVSLIASNREGIKLLYPEQYFNFENDTKYFRVKRIRYEEYHTKTITELKQLIEELDRNYLASNKAKVINSSVRATAGTVAVASVLTPVLWPVAVGGFVISTATVAKSIMNERSHKQWEDMTKNKLQQIHDEFEAQIMSVYTVVEDIQLTVFDIMMHIREMKFTSTKREYQRQVNISNTSNSMNMSAIKSFMAIRSNVEKVAKVLMFAKRQHFVLSAKYGMSAAAKSKEGATLTRQAIEKLCQHIGPQQQEALFSHVSNGLNHVATKIGTISNKSGSMTASLASKVGSWGRTTQSSGGSFVASTVGKLGKFTKVAGTGFAILGLGLDVKEAISTAKEINDGSKHELHDVIVKIIEIMEKENTEMEKLFNICAA